MASTSSSSRGRNAEILQASRKWNSANKGRNNIPNERETSPERSKVWTQACNGNNNNKVVNRNDVGESRRVPVVYYLSRNGQLEQPHFMEVPLSSNQGLYLRDVINRLNHLRGKGMASLYSWSAKRSYKNGFVWHDLSEDDLINPTHPNHQEYVLKGSEILVPEPPPPPPQQQQQQIFSSDHNNNNNINNHIEASSFRYPKEYPSDFPVPRRRNQSWSSIDLTEYKVYKAAEESSSESTRRMVAADAGTQTEERKEKGRRRRAQGGEIEEEMERVGKGDEIEEVSPPPSDSSPETLESLMKADGRLVLTAPPASEGMNVNIDNNDNTGTGEGSGKMKASTVLMQLISCGSLSFRDCGASAVKEQGLALIGGYKARLPRGSGRTTKESVSFPGVKLEDKEYFSGSLVETKIEKGEDVVPALKRSNSCNGDR